MDSNVDHSLDGADPDTIREPGWWLAVDSMVLGWKELKGMSPEELRRCSGGRI